MSIVLDGDKGVTQNTTEAARLPSGTTAERPANPVAGMIRFNTDENYFEGYDPFADDWFETSALQPPPLQATGGTETTITDNGVDYKVHTFTSSGTFEVTQGSGEVEYLVVAGGGSGGPHGSQTTGVLASGGGGAGEVLLGNFNASGGSYSVVVGAGGDGAAFLDRTDGEKGFSSSVFNVTAAGGGAGGNGNTNLRRNGASGGGEAGRGGGNGMGLTGNNGGSGGVENSTGAGGGGGQGAVGGNQPNGVGGEGVELSISGTAQFYAAGGGGGANNNGGSGIGGDAPGGTGEGGDAVPNTGSGGGGSISGNNVARKGGDGGSGIVIVRYPI